MFYNMLFSLNFLFYVNALFTNHGKILVKKKIDKNLEYHITNINERGECHFFSKLKGGECFFLTYLGVSDILLNLKGEEYNLSPKKKNSARGRF